MGSSSPNRDKHKKGLKPPPRFLKVYYDIRNFFTFFLFPSVFCEVSLIKKQQVLGLRLLGFRGKLNRPSYGTFRQNPLRKPFGNP